MPTGVDVIGQVQDSKKVTNFDLDVLVDADGNTKPANAIKDNAEDITLVAKSDISGQEGTYKFTLDDFFTGIVQSGLGEAIDNGYGDAATYTGTTSGILGDFNDDGGVGSADLLTFLSLFGNQFSGDLTELFQPSSIKVTAGVDQLVTWTADDDLQTLTFASDDTSSVIPGSQTSPFLIPVKRFSSAVVRVTALVFPGMRAGLSSRATTTLYVRTFVENNAFSTTSL